MPAYGYAGINEILDSPGSLRARPAFLEEEPLEQYAADYEREHEGDENGDIDGPVFCVMVHLPTPS